MIGRLWLAFKRWLFVRGPVTAGPGLHLGLGSFVSAPDKLEIGANVYVGKYCSIQCNGRIGNEVLIANNVGIVGRRDHDTRHIGVPMRSARSVSSSPELARDPRNAVEIGDDVWIGFGAIVLSGVRIGRGAVIGAGAVVFDDVEPYTIVRGNPAVAVGRRFSETDAARHEADWMVQV